MSKLYSGNQNSVTYLWLKHSLELISITGHEGQELPHITEASLRHSSRSAWYLGGGSHFE